MKSEIKALGERITKELDMVNDYDVLNKWMITYIAEQMHRYERAETEEEKLAAGEHCSDTIMKFWRHRAYNTSWYPFSDYKELYVGLNRLLAEGSGLDFLDVISSKYADDSSLPERIKRVKKVTGWLIEDMLEDAYSNQEEAGDDEWINIAKEMDDGDDARIVDRIAEAVQGRERMVEEMLERRIRYIEEIIVMYNDMLEREKNKKIDL